MIQYIRQLGRAAYIHRLSVIAFQRRARQLLTCMLPAANCVHAPAAALQIDPCPLDNPDTIAQPVGAEHTAPAALIACPRLQNDVRLRCRWMRGH
jgi:hypothetical protein